jgi:hypothetical protein
MSRYIGFVALLQFTLVMLGFFALAIVLKAGGYPNDPPFFASLSRVVWSPLALFLRHYGLVFLLVPAAWTICASFSQNRRTIFSQGAWLVIGVFSSAAIIALFIYACANRYAVVPN